MAQSGGGGGGFGGDYSSSESEWEEVLPTQKLYMEDLVKRHPPMRGGVVVVKKEEAYSRFAVLDVCAGAFLVFREPGGPLDHRVELRGAMVDFESTVIPAQGKLPSALAAFRVSPAVGEAVAAYQPPTTAASARWVGALLDVATGGDAASFLTISPAPRRRRNDYSALISRFSEGDRIARAVATRTKVPHTELPPPEPDATTDAGVERVLVGALRSRRLRDAARRRENDDRREAERAVARVLDNAARPPLRALVAKAVVAAYRVPPAAQAPAPRRAPRRPPMSRPWKPAVASGRSVVVDRGERPRLVPAGGDHPNSDDDDDLRYVLWLKTYAPSVLSSDSLCGALASGVALAAVLETALGVALPGATTAPASREAAVRNWEACLAALRRSGRIDNILASAAPTYDAMIAGDRAAARTLCRSVFAAYVPKRLRLRAADMLKWYDDVLRLYDAGLAAHAGVPPERDAWTPQVSSAFADGQRLDLVLRHALGGQEGEGGLLARAAALRIPCVFSSDDDFKAALESSSTAGDDDDDVHDFALLQLYHFWVGLRDRSSSRPRDHLRHGLSFSRIRVASLEDAGDDDDGNTASASSKGRARAITPPPPPPPPWTV